MKIVICDDNELELAKTRETVEKFINDSPHSITLEVFTSGSDLLSHISRSCPFDLLILDILMPGLNGIQLAAEIRALNQNCKIIFITSSPDFAVDSYDVKAYYYLLKPFSQSKLLDLLGKVLAELQKNPKSILVREKRKLTKVNIDSIQYVESMDHSLILHLNGREALSCFGTLNDYAKILLENRQFIRCHKSFIVNLYYVQSVTAREFILLDKTQIPISKPLVQQAKNAFIDFMFEKQ